MKSRHENARSNNSEMRNSVTVSEYIQQSRAHYCATLGHNSKATVVSRLNRLDKSIGAWEVACVTRADLEAFFKTLLEQLKLKTVVDYRTLVINIFDRATDDGVIAANPAKKVKLPRHKYEKPDPFSLNEIQQVLKTKDCCPFTKLIFVFGMATGLRPGELLALAWENVDIRSRRIIVCIARFRAGYKYTKTEGSERIIKLNDTALQALQTLFNITGQLPPVPIQLFTDNGQHPITKQFRFAFRQPNSAKPFTDDRQLSRRFKSLLMQCGVKYRPPKALRQTFTSQSLLAGVNKIHVARDLGHATTEMIDLHYFHYIPADAPDYQRSFDVHLEQVKPKKRKPWYRCKHPIGVLLTRLCMPQQKEEDW